MPVLLKNPISKREFLQPILRTYYNDQSITIRTIEEKVVQNRGNNFVTDILKLTVMGYRVTDENNMCLLKTFVVKFKPGWTEYNRHLHITAAFNNERTAYEKILPLLNQFLNIPLSYAKYVYANEETIVMVDMRSLGYHNIPKLNDINTEKIHSLILEMAKLHAASLIAQDHNPSEFNNAIVGLEEMMYCEKMEDEDDSEEPSLMEVKQKKTIDFVMAVIEAADLEESELKKIKNFLKDLRNNIWKKGFELFRKEHKIKVINHSDLWVNNFLFNRNDVVLIDWQNMRYTTPAVDLTCFLSLCLRPNHRVEHSEDFVAFYLKLVKEFIHNKVSEELEKSLTIEWLNRELLEADFYGYITSMMILPVFYCTEEEFDSVVSICGFENLTIRERFQYLRPEERERMINATRYFVRRQSAM